MPVTVIHESFEAATHGQVRESTVKEPFCRQWRECRARRREKNIATANLCHECVLCAGKGCFGAERLGKSIDVVSIQINVRI